MKKPETKSVWKSFCFGLLWALFSISQLSAETQPDFVVAGVELPPFVFEQGGEATGFMVDAIREASARAGVTVSFNLMPWQRAFTQIQTGEADGLIPTQHKPEREELLYFPPTPLHQFKFVVISHPDLAKKYQGNISELLGGNFVQVRGASIGPIFDQLIADGKIKPQWTNSFISISRMITAQRADYSVLPYLSALYYQSVTRLNIVPLMPPADHHPVFLAFSKASHYPPELRNRLTEALSAMQQDGSLARLEQSYIARYRPKVAHP